MSNETLLWNYIDQGMGGNWHASRVESGATAPGIPDVDYCIQGFMSNLELKYSKSKTVPSIRDSQYRWHWKRHEAGGRSYILTYFELAGQKDVYMVHLGKNVRKLRRDPSFATWWNLRFWHWKEHIDFDEFLMVMGNNV